MDIEEQGKHQKQYNNGTSSISAKLQYTSVLEDLRKRSLANRVVCQRMVKTLFLLSSLTMNTATAQIAACSHAQA